MAANLVRIVLAGLISVAAARADAVFFTGLITQSTQDGTGPAVNNPALNNISDGDPYTVNLSFDGSIQMPGTYLLSNFSLVFADATAGATESNFTSATVAITADGANYDFSLLGCLASGSGCVVGNELTAYFQIPAAALNLPASPASDVPGITPFDLLEDDGTTDIQGSVLTYSYVGSSTGASPVPEPSYAFPALAGLLSCLSVGLRRKRALRGGFAFVADRGLRISAFLFPIQIRRIP